MDRGYQFYTSVPLMEWKQLFCVLILSEATPEQLKLQLVLVARDSLHRGPRSHREQQQFAKGKRTENKCVWSLPLHVWDGGG